MFGLVTMLVSTLGATGMGSILKIIAGIVDRIAAGKEAQEKREMLREMRMAEASIEFQRSVFGNDEGGRFARSTRRLLALIGMLNFAAISILCTLWPTVPLITFVPPANRSEFSLLWGLFKFPLDNSTTVAITTGHLALSALVTLGAIVGFYFTPGGRTK
jgi:hypothetical protein